MAFLFGDATSIRARSSHVKYKKSNPYCNIPITLSSINGIQARRFTLDYQQLGRKRETGIGWNFGWLV